MEVEGITDRNFDRRLGVDVELVFDASITAPPKGSPNRFVEGFHRKLWWGSFRPGRLRDDFYANGHFGQRIYIAPDKSLVIVRLGREAGEITWTAFCAAIADAWPTAARP